MPTYSYQCEQCNHNFDVFHGINEEPVKICPQCNQPNVKRMIGAGAGLIFKGSGFYITDYRSKSYQEKAKSESSGSSSSGTGSTSSSSSSSSGSKNP